MGRLLMTGGEGAGDAPGEAGGAGEPDGAPAAPAEGALPSGLFSCQLRNRVAKVITIQVWPRGRPRGRRTEGCA